MVEGIIECPNCESLEVSCIKMKVLKDKTLFEYICLLCKEKFIYDGNGGFVRIGEI